MIRKKEILDIAITKVTLLQKIYFGEEIFSILEESYKNVEGGNLYKDSEDLILNTSEWELVWLNEEIVGCLIYKNKFGKKLVAIGVKDIPYKKFVLEHLSWYLKINLKYIWMEVSEGFEKWLLKNGFDKFIISPSEIKRCMPDKVVSISSDEMHYQRKIANFYKTKLAIGNLKRSKYENIYA